MQSCFLQRTMFLTMLTIFCALCVYQNSWANHDIELLFQQTRDQIHSSYKLMSTKQHGDIITKTYIREGYYSEGNTCSIWFEVHKQYMLTIEVNTKTKQVMFNESEEILSRDRHNGLE